jgi:lysophospholipase L1-like esterase
VLGDSIAWGEHLTFQETFPHQLEGLLADTEVINLGVTGYDTADQLARYERIVRPLHPTDVVVLYCLNDILIMSGPWSVHGDDSARARKKAQDELLDRLAPVRAETVEWVLGRREEEAPIKLFARARTLIATARYDRRDDYTDEFLLMYARPAAWSRVEAALTALGDAITADGARAHLVISPVLRLWEDYRWEAIHARVAETASASGFTVLDPIEVWRETRHPSDLRFPGDSIHYSGAGNRILAQTVARALSSPR